MIDEVDAGDLQINPRHLSKERKITSINDEGLTEIVNALFDPATSEVHKYKVRGANGFILVPGFITDFAQMDVMIRANDVRADNYNESVGGWHGVAIDHAKESIQKMESIKRMVRKMDAGNVN